MSIIKDKTTRWTIIYKHLEKSYNYECSIPLSDLLKLVNHEVEIGKTISASSLDKDLRYLKRTLGLEIKSGHKGLQLLKLVNFNEILTNHMGFEPVRELNYKHLYMEALRKLNTLNEQQLTEFLTTST